jgi:hypothetical protein
MKRIVIGLIIVFLLILAVLFLARPPDISPRYAPVQAQPAGPFAREENNWGDAVPFRGGKMWMWAVTPKTNGARSQVLNLLYDLDQQKVAGRLFNGGPVFANQDQSRLLCYGDSSMHVPLKQQLAVLANRLFHRTVLPTNYVEGFWVLDLRDNSSVWIGNDSQFPGTGSRWVPAPRFRFGYNRPSTINWGREFYLCDLEKESMQKINFIGDLKGWWDDHHLVATDANTNYELFDVINQTVSTLFTTAAVTQFLLAQGITNYPANYSPIFNWNGSNYDFYLTADRRNGLDTNATFVLRIEHDGPRFTLLSRNFQLHWAGYFDASGTHYLYSGESGAPGSGGNGGVYLRDVSNNLDRVLVPPDNHGQYALARLYGNTVIYWRDQMLWRMDINTTNSSRLFPPRAD